MSTMITKRAPAGRNLAYELSGDEVFSPTGYKLMGGMLESGFLPCRVYRYNGRPKLMYMAGERKPLSALGKLTGEQAAALLTDMLDKAGQLTESGILNPDNVELGMDRVFADERDLTCCFIFLPLQNGSGDPLSKQRFEERLLALARTVLDRWGEDNPMLRDAAQRISEGMLSPAQLRQLLERGRGGAIPSGSLVGLTGQRAPHLVGMDTPVRVDIVLTKPEFVVGRSANGVDGTISFNPAIGRRHCKIIQSDGKIYVEDLSSSNGTFVNGARIQEGVAVQVSMGDRIRLANSDFQLQEG